jgi:hypothetical protein
MRQTSKQEIKSDSGVKGKILRSGVSNAGSDDSNVNPLLENRNWEISAATRISIQTRITELSVAVAKISPP